MDIKKLIAQAASKYGNTSNVVLKASESTGQPPCELFITDEHTENYLTLQMAGDADRGAITGIAAGVGSLASIALAFMMIIKAAGILSAFVFSLPRPYSLFRFILKRENHCLYLYYLIVEQKKFIFIKMVICIIRHGTTSKLSRVNFK